MLIRPVVSHVLQRMGDLLTSASVTNHGGALVQLCTWSSVWGQKSQYCVEFWHPGVWAALSVLSHLRRKQAPVAPCLDGKAPNRIHLAEAAADRESLRPFAKRPLHGPSNISPAYLLGVDEFVQCHVQMCNTAPPESSCRWGQTEQSPQGVQWCLGPILWKVGFILEAALNNAPPIQTLR